MRYLTGVFCALALAATAAAQDAPSAESQARLDQARAALDAGDPAAAYAEAERALALAQTPNERFNAFHTMAQARDAQERWSDAAALFGQAALVLETHNPENRPLWSAMLRQQSGAYLRAGRRQEWLETLDRIIALNAVDHAQLWRFEGSGLRHRFTGYPCPNSAGVLVLQELRTFRADGLDVSCQFAFPERLGPVVTMHIYQDNGNDAEGAFDLALGSVQQVFPDGRTLENSERMVGGEPVRFAILRTPDRTTGVWTTQVANWTLKLRLTHFGQLQRADLDAAADAVFAPVGEVRAHLARCAALTGAAEPIDPEGEAVDTLTMETALMMTLDFVEPAAAPDALQCHLGDPGLHRAGSSAFASLDDDGAVLGYHARPTAAGPGLTVDAMPRQGLAALLNVAGGAEADAPYIVTVRNPQAAFVVGFFESAPSPEAFMTIAGAIGGETIRPLARIEAREDEEGLNITLYRLGDGPEAAEVSEPEGGKDGGGE